MSSTVRAHADRMSIDMRDGVPSAARTQAMTPTDNEATGHTSRRSIDVWDFLGVMVVVFTMMLVTEILPRIFPQWISRLGLLSLLTAATGVTLVAAVGILTYRERLTRADVAQRLMNVWRNPPGDWPAFILGWAVSLPLLGLYLPTPYADSDSVRLIAAIRHVQRGNLDFLTQTQDSFGPHILLGPFVLAGTPALMRLFTIASMQLLAAVLAWQARRLSGSMAAAAIVPLALVSIAPFTGRVHYLPMYPTMLALASVGAWLSYRTVIQHAGWRHALGAGAFLVLALETQAVGQLLVAVPLLLLVLAKDLRRSLYGLAQTYASIALFLVPRLLVNLQQGGLSNLRSNRTDYWITKGYLKAVQEDLWGYAGLGESHLTYILEFPGRFVSSLGDSGWVPVVLAVLAVIATRGRTRWFVLAFAGLIMAAMTIRTIQPFPRYFSPLWVGVALLAGIVCAKLLSQRTIAARAVGVVGVAALSLASVSIYVDTAKRVRQVDIARERSHIQEVTELIDDGRGVIGARSHTVIAGDIDIPTYGGQFLSEEEYATYLTWPSDEEVIHLMQEHDIGWVLVRRETTLETSYHDVWLVPNHGRRARHIYMVATSPHFCPAVSAGSVMLYKLGSC